MSNENSNSKNSPENKKRSWHKEPWYKRLFDKILVSCFLPCKHEWEVLEASGRHMITAVLSTMYADVGVRNAER